MGDIREVEPLSDYNEQKHLEAVKKGEIELYENEYHLIEQALSLPQKFMELGELEQRMVLLFIDKEFIEPHSQKKTENDAFISFLAAYDKKEVVKSIYMLESKIIGYDKDGNEMLEYFTIINPEKLPLYMKLKSHATMVWKNSNLKEISKTMREIMTNSGYRDEELLEQRIMSDALSNDKDNFTMQNRKAAIDIKGLRKPTSMQQINVFLEGGGKKANDVIIETTKNEVYSLVPEETEKE